jgi:hypothetical protein
VFPPAGSEIYRNEAGEVLGWGRPESAEDYYCDFCGISHTGECLTDVDIDDEEAMIPYNEEFADEYKHNE